MTNPRHSSFRVGLFHSYFILHTFSNLFISMLTSRFSDALLFASQLHAAQTRKVSGEPYLAHLLGAASIVMDYGGDEDEAIAALLHDAVEDQGGATVRAEILARFGEPVAAIVDGCTDADTLPKPPWRPRKEAFLARLRTASPSIRLVVAADKLHNLRALTREYRRKGESLWKHFQGGRDDTLWYHRSVAEILEAGGDSLLVAELQRTREELERLIAENPK
jgi:(p)ppGpp synthase/HD superfamily hydrolase